MNRLPQAILFVVGTVFAAEIVHAQPSRAAACLRYGPDTVAITGRLARHVFYGAPGFGEDPAHDEPEPAFYLELARPVCTVAGEPESGDEARRGVRRVQLLLDSKGYASLRPFLGRRLTLRGTLGGAITGHHHAPLLLEVVKPAQPVGTR
jgi:hypothetical protein